MDEREIDNQLTGIGDRLEAAIAIAIGTAKHIAADPA